MAFQDGDGIAKDSVQALQWYRKAAEANDSNGMCLLASMYLEGEAVTKDDAEAYHWYAKAAALKHPMAMYAIGSMYEVGNGIGKDAAQAAQWYQKAADVGHVDAMFRLGNLYFSGRGVKRDVRSAHEWYQKAAEQEHGEAAFNLGGMYAKGIGIEKDTEQALKWFELAKKNGFERAPASIESIKRQPFMDSMLAFTKQAQQLRDQLAMKDGLEYETFRSRYDQLADGYTKVNAPPDGDAQCKNLSDSGKQLVDIYKVALEAWGESINNPSSIVRLKMKPIAQDTLNAASKFVDSHIGMWNRANP